MTVLIRGSRNLIRCLGVGVLSCAGSLGWLSPQAGAVQEPASMDTWGADQQGPFLNQAEQDLRAQSELPADFWEWLGKHPELRAGLLTIEAPVPPVYAQNLEYLRRGVGGLHADTYGHLLLAVAVQSKDLIGERALWDAGEPDKAIEPSEEAQSLARYIRESEQTLGEALADPAALHESAGTPLPTKKKHRNQLWSATASMLQAYPDRQRTHTLASIKRLIALHESPQEGHTGPWPIFPMAHTPWPLLAPLQQLVPPNEADHVLQRYRDTGKVKTYAKYTWDYENPHIRFKSSEWHPSSIPRVIEDGGVCGRLSTLAQYSWVALGRPAMGMYQPGHRAVLSYSGQPGKSPFLARLGQSVKPIAQSTANWWIPGYSGWRTGKRTGVEHHMGLAFAMNLGLDRYHSGRIALIEARALRESSPDEAIALLSRGMRTNPFDVELIYTLADYLKSDAEKTKALLESVAELMGTPPSLELQEELSNQTDFNTKVETIPTPKKEIGKLVKQVQGLIRLKAGLEEESADASKE